VCAACSRWRTRPTQRPADWNGRTTPVRATPTARDCAKTTRRAKVVSRLIRRSPGRRRHFPLFVTEVDRALLQHEFLALGRREVDAVGVDESHRVLEPQLPPLLRDLREEPLSQIALERRSIKPGKFLLQQPAVDDALRHE